MEIIVDENHLDATRILNVCRTIFQKPQETLVQVNKITAAFTVNWYAWNFDTYVFENIIQSHMCLKYWILDVTCDWISDA